MKLEEVEARLHGESAYCELPHEPDGKLAAVLILLQPGDNGLELVLTRRSLQLSRHAGQISLPGGLIDPHEDNVSAALREAEEEIGLQSAGVRVLACLDWLDTANGYIVSPVIACTEQRQQWRPDPEEVAEVFSLPLDLILDIDTYEQGSMMRNGVKRLFYHFDYKDYYVWGITARILRNLAERLRQPDNES